MRYYNQMDGLLRAQFAYPDVEFCVISPEEPLNDGLYPLTFDSADIAKMVAQGEADGTKALTDCRANTEAHMQFYSLKKAQDPRMAGLDFTTFKSQRAEGLFEEFTLANVNMTAPNSFLQ